MMARRTWKRDLSSNVMPLEAALDNLERTAQPPTLREREKLRRLLARGKTVESAWAFFEVDPDAPEVEYRSVNPRPRRLAQPAARPEPEPAAT